MGYAAHGRNLVCRPMATQTAHPLAGVLTRAADGVFPPVDGLVEWFPPDHAGTCAVVCFTGHAYVLTNHDPAAVARFAPDGFGAALDPALLIELAGPGGRIDSTDVVLVRRGLGGGSDLATSDDLEHHARVRRSRGHRRSVRVLGDERGLVTIGSGLADRTEMSVELIAGEPGRGAGRALITAGLHHVAAGAPVFAQVAPGNAASLRAFLACGFVPIGSEVLIERGSRS